MRFFDVFLPRLIMLLVVSTGCVAAAESSRPARAAMTVAKPAELPVRYTFRSDGGVVIVLNRGLDVLAGAYLEETGPGTVTVLVYGERLAKQWRVFPDTVDSFEMTSDDVAGHFRAIYPGRRIRVVAFPPPRKA